VGTTREPSSQATPGAIEFWMSTGRSVWPVSAPLGAIDAFRFASELKTSFRTANSASCCAARLVHPGPRLARLVFFCSQV